MAFLKRDPDNNQFDYEASIQISRILKILSDTTKNTEIILCLPLLLADDGAILENFFSSDQINMILKSCNKLKHCSNTESPEIKPSLLEDMCPVVSLLLSKPDLCHYCRSSLSERISEGGAALLRSLEELNICVSEQLKVTPIMQAQQDKELRVLSQQNIQNEVELKILKDKLAKMTAETEQDLEEKKKLIKQQLEKMSSVKQQSRENVKKRMDEAERQINWDIKNSEYRFEELQAEAKATQYRRDIQLKEHLSTEKELRSKRYKLESQLVAMLQKYDSDIGERHAMLEELTANYEEEETQLEKLQAQFEEQEVEYHSLMMEKEQFEREELEIKLRDIRRRIAARKIQRFYRAYLTKRSKKGLKKGKKGKKKK